MHRLERVAHVDRPVAPHGTVGRRVGVHAPAAVAARTTVEAAVGAGGQRLRGRVAGQGHPGYRSTPEMAVAVAAGVALGTLGGTPHCGVVTPATGLGLEAVPALEAAAARARAGDRVVVFGSFLTVGPALSWLGIEV